ncbi:MAG TPA: DUF1653 domain-containing protein [Candidatus Aquilonibacter sp.]|nr:DUF1653 domain-containing protein [Candidatus Aquilonibacter sp.]
MRIKKGLYQHFKGKRYRVLGIAHHSESLDELVIYQALYTSKEFGKNALWARPAKMFVEKVRHEGKMVPRFKFLKSE